ncbi:hypothetical protein C2845_PM06G31690 [Panicum miliaceum]|uniref:Cytochrome P450 n=1 Tax=Panicum miliaceum TaxID=4540 RepID=A0A3L6RFV7_PANMI|nr:hypothetical protein C2845_PM06G31690 [Panicum miliaceum]
MRETGRAPERRAPPPQAPPASAARPPRRRARKQTPNPAAVWSGITPCGFSSPRKRSCFAIPHRAREDTVVVGGYDVPSRRRATRPASWPDAFRPEGFLAGGLDVRGARFQLPAPFVSGRRMCPATGVPLVAVAEARLPALGTLYAAVG